MPIKFPKAVVDLYDEISLENIVLWTKELSVFYAFQPVRFFKSFFNRTAKEQYSQTIYYTVILALLSLIFSEKFEFANAYRFIVSIIVLTFPFTILNCIGLVIVSRSKFRPWKVAIFIYLIWTILSIPVVIFISIFISSENYAIYFFVNLLNALGVFYSIFLIWPVFLNRLGKIILGILINLTILNVFALAFIFLFFDRYTKEELDDSLISEFKKYGEHIKLLSPEGIPVSFIRETNLLTYEEKCYIKFSNAPVTYYKIDSFNTCNLMAEENIKYVDSILPLLEFKRNKQIFGSFLEYNRNITKIFSSPYCDTCVIKDSIPRLVHDSLIIHNRQEYKISQTVTKPLIEFQSQVQNLKANYNLAYLPSQISIILIKPAIIVAKALGATGIIRMKFFF